MPYGQYAYPGSSTRREDDEQFTRGDAPKERKGRQRQVYPSDEIPHLWAHQTQASARNPQGNLFFDGPTLYSYGHHYPLATLRTGVNGEQAAIINDSGWSNTTAGHISMARRAVPNGMIVFLLQADSDTAPEALLDVWNNKIAKLVSAVAAPRIRPDTHATRMEALESAVEHANQFARIFGLARSFSVPDSAALDAARDRIKAEAKQAREAKQERERREADALALRQVELSSDLAAWQRGETLEYWRVREIATVYKVAFLRLRGDEVETTLGASVPIEHVRKALPVVLALILSGKTYARNGHALRLGHYTLDSIDASGTVRVGCHVIERPEVERIATELGVRA